MRCEIVAADEEALVEAVRRHMAEEHDSFELEDVIIDMSTEVETRGGGRLMADATRGDLDPDVVRRFHFTGRWSKGPVYRKYKFAIHGSGTSTTSTSPRTPPTGSESRTSSARACSA